ncbi:FAD-binding oxidoreductase [Actinoplanes sp. TBRC 11911]|uniref:FAD-binding oxidoreductase n=1 Tax=Actinoplanes sp. TBRC 11911 TaxID=2729386 RepID=UPI001B7D686C|nr:FAD-binding oxidoreductase [Actinoplanes sp. TBRC 11911]
MSAPSDHVLNALVDICGPDYARLGRSVDTVAGHRVPFVAVPATTTMAAEVLRLAREHGLMTLTRGSGSKIDWGAPRNGIDLLIDTGRLSGLWNHQIEAATAEIGTGTPVRALQSALALHGQRLAADPPSRTATVGGMLAVNEAGPLRHRFGTPAEHVLKVTYVDRAGVVSESDGEDGRPGLAEIDGVITSAVVRLEPLPGARRWVTVAVPTPLQIIKLSETAREVEPSALEIDLPADGLSGTLVALLEGPNETDVVERSDRLAEAWGASAGVAPIAPPWWGRYPFDRTEVALRLAVSASDLPAALYALGDATGGAVPARGSAGVASVFAVLPGSLGPERAARIVESVRHVLMARNGRVVVVSAPAETARRIEMAAYRDLF